MIVTNIFIISGRPVCLVPDNGSRLSDHLLRLPHHLYLVRVERLFPRQLADMPEQDLNTKQILSEKTGPSQNERLLDFKLYYKKTRNQETFRNKFILGLLYNHT
jgi:hypothetical protein